MASFLSGEFLIQIQCWLQFYARSFAYAIRAFFFFIWGICLTHLMLVSFFIWGVSLTHPVLVSSFFLSFFLFLLVDFLLHISCWLHFCLGSFSYTFRAGFIFLWEVSLTHSVLASCLSGEFLLHIPCWFLFFFYLGSFSYTSRAGFSFVGSFTGMRSSLKTTPKEKSWVEDGPEKNVKKSRSKQRRNPTTPYTEQIKTKQELSDKWQQRRKGKSTKKNSTQLLRTNSLEKSLERAHSEERREPSNALNRTEQNNTEQELSEK